MNADTLSWCDVHTFPPILGPGRWRSSSITKHLNVQDLRSSTVSGGLMLGRRFKTCRRSHGTMAAARNPEEIFCFEASFTSSKVFCRSLRNSDLVIHPRFFFFQSSRHLLHDALSGLKKATSKGWVRCVELGKKNKPNIKLTALLNDMMRNMTGQVVSN